jgi:hypothetical protein
VLGPLLFLIFINDLDLAVSLDELLVKFADDTKLARIVKSDEDRRKLQLALGNLVKWTREWGMLFNIKKCKVMHLGRANLKCEYSMEGVKLEVTKEEKDLGVLITDNLKPSAQCAQAAKTAQSVLGQIARAFGYRDRRVFLQLYKQYVRPHLEFAVQAWSPWHQADKEVLEKVQKRAVAMVSGLVSRDYEDRLKELMMTTLEERRHQADMLQMYKIASGAGQLDEEGWFRPPPAAAARTRHYADPLNVRPNHGRLEIRRQFFSVRAAEQWNGVPAPIKRARTAAAFKRAYATHRDEMILN